MSRALKLGAVGYLLAALAGSGPAAGDAALIMPRAEHSLLLDIDSNHDRLLVVGERGHILVSTDQGRVWRQTPSPTSQMLTAVHLRQSGQAWAVGHDGLILVSDDGGERWRQQRNGLAAQEQANIEAREQAHDRVAGLQQALRARPDDPDLQDALEAARWDLEDAEAALAEPVFTSPLLDVYFQDRLKGFAVGAFNLLLATRDGGHHWENISDRVDNPDEFHLNSITGDDQGRVFIAGEAGALYRSLDGGDHWQSVETPYEGSWFGVVYSEKPDCLIIFGLRGAVFRSTDFGSSWSPSDSENRMSLAGGTVAPDGRVYLVGAVGTVLVSEDDGRSFHSVQVADRQGLSAVSRAGEQLIVVGQGGVRRIAGAAADD